MNNGVATQHSPNVNVLGMADERGEVNTLRPFLVVLWNGSRIATSIHGFAGQTDTYEIPKNWVPS